MTSPFTTALDAARQRYAAKRPKSRELYDRARAVLPGGSTRSVLDIQPFPFRVASAVGARLTDVDGHGYLDLLGDYSAGFLGHTPGPVAAAVGAALDRGWSYGGMHVDEIRFAELVCDRFPSIEQVRFTNSGTEANLMALQLARHHTGRDTIVVCDAAYHGGLLYFGAGGEDLLAPFDFRRVTFNDPSALDAAVDTSVAAIIVEPMMGGAGCIPATDPYLGALRAAADRSGALLIFDEVMTSRMSRGGAQLRRGVHPDLTTLGKYLAGGMTFGAFGGRADIMRAFDPASGGELTHGGTFNNNVVTMAGGVATLSELLDADTLDAVYERGESVRARLQDLCTRSTLPLCVSGMGSMLTIHAVEGPVRSPADTRNADLGLKELLFHEVLDRGAYLAPRGFVAMSLEIGEHEAAEFVDIVASAVGTIEAATER